MRDTPLFWSQDGHNFQQAMLQRAVADVAQMTEQQILNTDGEELVQYLVEKHAISVPELDADNMTVAQKECTVTVRDWMDERTVEVPGVAFDFEIPFSGDTTLFHVRPSTYDHSPPHATLCHNIVCFSVIGRDLTPDQVKQQMEQTKGSIQKYLGFHRQFWSGWPNMLAQSIGPAIEQRRRRLQQRQGVASSLASLGVKLREKPGDPRAYAPPAVKRKLEPKMPPMKASAKPDPMLDDDTYAIILGLLRDAGKSIEQSSSRMRSLDEEALRDVLLVPLNAHFGAATGEAFNCNGKTDILIKHQGGNVFVAECKIWSGAKALLAAIDQLLNYLTWRDTKAVLVVFNRNAGFSQVAAQLGSAPPTHPQFVSGPKELSETAFQFKLKLPQDAARHVTLTVMGFDLGVS